MSTGKLSPLRRQAIEMWKNSHVGKHLFAGALAQMSGSPVRALGERPLRQIREIEAIERELSKETSARSAAKKTAKKPKKSKPAKVLEVESEDDDVSVDDDETPERVTPQREGARYKTPEEAFFAACAELRSHRELGEQVHLSTGMPTRKSDPSFALGGRTAAGESWTKSGSEKGARR